MNAKFLALVMISGLILSGSSVYLSQMVYADDPWSQIAQRELVAQQTAALTYSDKYPFYNTNGSHSNWSGLYSITTGGYVPNARNLAAATNASLNNALSEFGKNHGEQLNVHSTNYTGLNSTTTGENGRNRNTLIADARVQSLNASESIVSNLSMVSKGFTNLNDSGTTNEQNAYNRQAQIDKTWDAMNTQATALLSNLTRVDTAFLNLQANGTTTGYVPGSRDLSAAQAESLDKAIQIFQEIQARHLSATQSTNYTGLNSTTTNEQQAYSRSVEIANASQLALQNALNLYNAYYNGVGLNQTAFSH